MNFKNNNDFLFTQNSKLSNLEGSNSNQSRKYRIFIFHKILDGFNASLLILIFLLSFISLDSQKKWTNFYSKMRYMRSINNNLVDYISNTEEFYIAEIDKLDNLKKTNSKDLIYISKKIKPKKTNEFSRQFSNLWKGIREGIYQRGTL
tara:strand:+ start:294 stop:737 length:444 start_codon:yes stop_codon:yes gene_type:complete